MVMTECLIISGHQIEVSTCKVQSKKSVDFFSLKLLPLEFYHSKQPQLINIISPLLESIFWHEQLVLWPHFIQTIYVTMSKYTFSHFVQQFQLLWPAKFNKSVFQPLLNYHLFCHPRWFIWNRLKFCVLNCRTFAKWGVTKLNSVHFKQLGLTSVGYNNMKLNAFPSAGLLKYYWQTCLHVFSALESLRAGTPRAQHLETANTRRPHPSSFPTTQQAFLSLDFQDTQQLSLKSDFLFHLFLSTATLWLCKTCCSWLWLCGDFTNAWPRPRKLEASPVTHSWFST